MKSSTISSLSALTLAFALIAACGDEDKPQPPPPPPIKAVKIEHKQPAPVVEEPELVPIQSLAAQKEEPVVAKDTSTASTTVKQPSDFGTFVIQISVQQTQKAAENVIKKLADHNIKAYIAEVSNPADLHGTFYRIRIGYFSTTRDAQEYGREVLSPLNYGWWVDNVTNDNVGNPKGVAAAPAQQPAAAKPAPQPAPVAKPAPAQQPAAAKPAPQPAPAAQPAPAQQPAAAKPAPQPAPAAKPAPAQQPAAAKPAPQPAPAAQPAPAQQPAAAKPAPQPAPAAQPAPAQQPAAAKPAPAADDWD